MNNHFYFTLILFIIGSSSLLQAQNCNAATAAEIAACAADPATTTITITASNATIDVTSPVDLDLRGITMVLGNSSVTLPAGTQVDMGTSFDAGGNDGVSVAVGGTTYFYNNNGGGSPSPTGTLAELNTGISEGLGNTLGEVVAALNGALPVALISFEAEAMDKKVMLSWVVAEESENEAFEISISRDGLNFQLLETVDGRGNVLTAQSYEISDVPNFSGDVYYRLTQRDFSGVSRELGIRSVRWEAGVATGLSVFPNPGSAGQMIRLQGAAEATSLDLFGMNGKLLRQLAVANGQVIVPNNVAAGVYLLRVPGKEMKPVRLVIK